MIEPSRRRFSLGPAATAPDGLAEHHAAYLAGVLDGGWLGITRGAGDKGSAPHYTAAAVVTVRDADLLAWLVSSWGGRAFGGRWRATGDDLRWLLGAVGPFLRVKARQAACLRQLLDMQDGTNRRRSQRRLEEERALYVRAQLLNRGASA